MKTTFLLLSFSLVSASLQAQYYYKELLGLEESSALHQTYRGQQVRRVEVRSYDAEGQRLEGFRVAQSYDPAARLLTTVSESPNGAPSVLRSWSDASGRVVRTVDSGASSVTTTEYTYRDGKLASSRSRSGEGVAVLEELHLWTWNGGVPEQMLRIKNGRDTTTIQFVQDEKGQVAEERTIRKGSAGEPYFYYYNEAGRLSDVVRFNQRAKRLLPEYLLEWDGEGRVIQRITVPALSSDYLIWRYQWDGRGLKVREAVYDKGKTLQGKVEYTYSTE